MYLIQTYVDRSKIEGNGVFAGEDVAEGAIIWREQPGFDVVMTEADVRALPPPARAYMDTYSYWLNDRFHLNADNGKFTNHDDNPNSRMNDKGEMVAVRVIKKGEEITADYDEFSHDRPAGVFG